MDVIHGKFHAERNQSSSLRMSSRMNVIHGFLVSPEVTGELASICFCVLPLLAFVKSGHEMPCSMTGLWRLLPLARALVQP
eukprot:COSAG02_NODE_7364_length_3047_cov_2.912822_1_plen_81_part_00